jgi:hypothetical protein
MKTEKKDLLQSKSISKMRQYKVCIVCKSKTKLRKILNHHYPWFKIGKEARCGWVGFIYFETFREAFLLREKYYNDKDMYIFIQDDKPILKIIGE